MTAVQHNREYVVCILNYKQCQLTGKTVIELRERSSTTPCGKLACKNNNNILLGTSLEVYNEVYDH